MTEAEARKYLPLASSARLWKDMVWCDRWLVKYTPYVRDFEQALPAVWRDQCTGKVPELGLASSWPDQPWGGVPLPLGAGSWLEGGRQAVRVDVVHLGTWTC